MVEGVRLESVCAQKAPRVQIPLSPKKLIVAKLIYAKTKLTVANKTWDLNRSALEQFQGESLVTKQPAQDAPESAEAAWKEQTG